MNTIDELKIAIDEAMYELSNRINEIEANKTNEPDDKLIGLDEFLKLQRENAVILQELTNDIRNSDSDDISTKEKAVAITKIYDSLIPNPELTNIPGGNFGISQDEVDSNLKRIEDIKSILNGEYLDSDEHPPYVDGSLPLIIDNKFSEIYAENVSVYMGRIYDYLDSYAFWKTVVGTPVHAKINMLLRRLKSLLNVDDLCIFDTENRGNVTRYLDAIAPSIKSAYDIAESSILWELENISNYLPVAFDEASRWRYVEGEYVYKTETESNEDASQDETPQDEEPSDEYEKECASSENDDSTDDSSESDFDGTPNDDDTENFPTMEKEKPSEETPEIKAEESEIGLILESESNTSAPPQDETTPASSDVDWDNVVTCLFGYVNSAKRWINNDSVGDTGQIQIINHMGNLLSTKSSDIAGSYPIFSKTINQLAIDAKKPVKLPETIEEFSKEFMV